MISSEHLNKRGDQLALTQISHIYSVLNHFDCHLFIIVQVFFLFMSSIPWNTFVHLKNVRNNDSLWQYSTEFCCCQYISTVSCFIPCCSPNMSISLILLKCNFPGQTLRNRTSFAKIPFVLSPLLLSLMLYQSYPLKFRRIGCVSSADFQGVFSATSIDMCSLLLLYRLMKSDYNA